MLLESVKERKALIIKLIRLMCGTRDYPDESPQSIVNNYKVRARYRVKVAVEISLSSVT